MADGSFNQSYMKGMAMKNFKCNKCGNCCKNLFDGIALNEPDLKYFRNAKIVPLMAWGKSPKKNTTVMWKLIETRCPNYDDDKGCTIYENRPMACRLFPIGQNMQDEIYLDPTCLVIGKHQYGIDMFVSDEDAVEWNTNNTNRYNHNKSVMKRFKGKKQYMFHNNQWLRSSKVVEGIM
jgi:Fe-S-cluster containining protein